MLDPISMELMTSFINQTGFPIAAAAAMFVLYFKTVKGLQTSLDHLSVVVNKMADCRKECQK